MPTAAAKDYLSAFHWREPCSLRKAVQIHGTTATRSKPVTFCLAMCRPRAARPVCTTRSGDKTCTTGLPGPSRLEKTFITDYGNVSIRPNVDRHAAHGYVLSARSNHLQPWAAP